MDPENISAIKELAANPPAAIGDLHKVLGLLRYFRWLIQNIAQTAHALEHLQPESSEGKKFSHDCNHGQLNPKTEIVWQEQHHDTLSKMMKAIRINPILSCPDFNRRFTLSTHGCYNNMSLECYWSALGE